MPYVKRTVRAGAVIETKKMYSPRVHVQGIKRSVNQNETKKSQEAVNERKSEERLRWKLNANFGYRDYHVVLHYADKTRTLEECLKDKELFMRRLRYACKRAGIKLSFEALCTETKRMTNIHHHIVMKRIPVELIEEAWESVPGGAGISFRPLDRRGNHAKLAHYLMKESRSTLERMKEAKINGKRFSCSRNLDIPVPTYETVSANSWKKDPRARKGYFLFKFDDGATARAGWHEVTGYPFQEYYEISEVVLE